GTLGRARNAKRMPARESEYRNLILTQRVEPTNLFIPPGVWKACGESPGSLDGLTLYAGLDLSEVADLTALVLIGWRDGKWRVEPTFWVPSGGGGEEGTTERLPPHLLRGQGFLWAPPAKNPGFPGVA